MTKKKIFILGVGFIILLMILTNPSYTRFKEFTGGEKKFKMAWHGSVITTHKRYNNWLLFSIYEYGIINEKNGGYYPSQRYLGIFNNFYLVHNYEKE